MSDRDIIGTRPPADLGPLFAQPVVREGNAPSRPREVPAGRLRGGRVVDALRLNRPDDHAILAASTDDAEKLLELAERAANAILDAQRWMTVGLVRKHLGEIGKLANDGEENLNALGALGRRMRLCAIATMRQPKELEVTHGNRGTVWVRSVDFLEMREYFEELRRKGEAA